MSKQYITTRRIGKYKNLVINVEYSVIQNNLITFWVPFPATYPRTPLRKHLYKWQTKHYGIHKGQERLAMSEIILGEDKAEVGFSLFVFPNDPDYVNIVTEHEKTCCRGFGKELLCFALKWLLANKYVGLKHKVVLEAGGGTCKITPESELMTITDADKFLEAYKKDVDEADATTPLERRRLACAIQENKKLVNYYENTYGFKITDDSIGMQIQMEAPLSSVIKKCNCHNGERQRNKKHLVSKKLKNV